MLSDFEIINVLSLSNSAFAIYTTEDMIVETANDVMLSFWKKDRSIIGKPLGESVPEVIEQDFIALLQNVWRTGTTYQAANIPFQIAVNGELQSTCFDFEYRAVKKETGEMYCILHTATDVTERVRNQSLIEETNQQSKDLQQKQVVNDELSAAIAEQETVTKKLVTTLEQLNQVNTHLEEQVTTRTQELQESEGRFRRLVEQAPIAINIFETRDMVVTFANEEMLKLWDKKPEQMNRPFIEIFPELEGQPFLQLLDEVFTTGEAYYGYENKAFIVRKGQKEEAYFNLAYQPVKDIYGAVVNIIQVLTEVTEQVTIRMTLQQMNEELTGINEELVAANEDLTQAQHSYIMLTNQSEKHRSDLLFTIKAAGMGTFDLNIDTNHFTINELLANWSGVEPGEDIDMNTAVMTTVAEDDQERLMKALQEALQFNSGGNFDIEYTIINPHNPVPRTVRARGKTIFNEAGEPTQLSGVVQDITEQKRDEQRKNDFIAMVSHEMKTPLTTLSGYLQLLQMKADNADSLTVTMLTKSNQQVSRIVKLINGFLNVSRLESGKIQIDKERFDLAVLLTEVEQEMYPTVYSHRILMKKMDEAFVFADRDKIGQVINNLISNALKYAPGNTVIEVACRTAAGNATVSIRDEGIGIQAEDQPKIFDRYFRVNDGKHMIASGFGIGLYLCAEIIQRHDGNIWVESELGKGSTFSFSLPVVE